MKGEAFVKLPRDLLESTAWRTLRPHTKLLLEFLMIEHMRHGGKRNGFLLAPRRQLVVFGIDTHLISRVIDEAEQLGVIDCKRGTGRRPSLYSLTWLPLSDGTGPTNRWRNCNTMAAEISAVRRQAKARPRPAVASGKSHSQEMSGKSHSHVVANPTHKACSEGQTPTHNREWQIPLTF